MMSSRGVTLVIFLLAAAWASGAHAHCQIPCGIYTDEMRFQMIDEHITTIEKSMKQIEELSASGERNDNQLVRWIHNKETHAAEIQEIVHQYFLTQRVKPVDPSQEQEHRVYLRHLEMLHHMLVFAMKTRQSLDPANIAKLRSLNAAYHDLYFEGKEHTHE